MSQLSSINDASCQRCPWGYYTVIAAFACQLCDDMILIYVLLHCGNIQLSPRSCVYRYNSCYIVVLGCGLCEVCRDTSPSRGNARRASATTDLGVNVWCVADTAHLHGQVLVSSYVIQSGLWFHVCESVFIFCAREFQTLSAFDSMNYQYEMLIVLLVLVLLHLHQTSVLGRTVIQFGQC